MAETRLEEKPMTAPSTTALAEAFDRGFDGATTTPESDRYEEARGRGTAPSTTTRR